ncbi:MAG: sel1 repeat family protein [bacterium]|nr:sel1 repeat family protein [bacterium]
MRFSRTRPGLRWLLALATGALLSACSETDIAKISAHMFDPAAQTQLAMMYMIGDGVERDVDEARRWYRKAAEVHHPEALFGLAEIYSNGTGVEKDPGEAMHLYLLAAGQGHPRAQYQYGIGLLDGVGAEVDLIQAHKWLNLSAVSGIDAGFEALRRVESLLAPGQIAKARELAREFNRERNG